MARTFVASIFAIAVVAVPIGSLAQSGGGAGGGSAGPAIAGRLNNSVNGPSGVGKSDEVASEPPSGSNSLGTANSTGSSMTTGSAGSSAGMGSGSPGSQTRGDAVIDQEDKAIDRKLKSICRGC